MRGSVLPKKIGICLDFDDRVALVYSIYFNRFLIRQLFHEISL